MFDALTNKFNNVFKSLSGRGRITEANVSEAMRQVRKALLEADVNYSVAKQFCKDVTAAALGADVIKSLHPSQVMVKIVNDELTKLMGPVDTNIYFVSPGPTIIMLAGLQGSMAPAQEVAALPSLVPMVLMVPGVLALRFQQMEA